MDTEKTAVEIEWIQVIMQILVDADACPVVGIVESLAEKYNIPTTLLCDTNHVLYSDYSDVIIVGAGADAVDYKLISICHKGDMERPRFDIVASGERMREIRRQRNISVKQVMEYMGFESTQAVYKWEAGKCYPQADNLVALAILYNVSPMELLVEENRVSSSSCLWGNLFVA